MDYYKILSMDGGLGSTLASLLHGLNARLPATHKTYLNQADLFAGTSVGAMTSLFLAKHSDPTEALDDWDDFTRLAFSDVIGAENIPNLLGSFLGVNSIFTVDRLRGYLVDYFGKTLTLGDLKKRVLVVAFQLDNGLDGADRRWGPRIFTNFEGSPDCDELVVDVALRSSALPIGYPIYQSLAATGPGFVDGFVVANNPSMIAMCEVIDSHPMDEMLVFSLGTGANLLGKTMYLEPQMANGIAGWGYRQWLLDPKRPLLLLDLLSQSSSEQVDFQCQKLLGDRYLRLEPVLVNEAVPDYPETLAWFDKTAEWLQTSGWMRI
jgi:patatin-like phospholipase/acyl hydrolase